MLKKRPLRAIFAGVTALVSLAGLGVEVMRWTMGWKSRERLVALLSLSYEENLPTFYSATLLLLASAVSALLAADPRPKRGERVAWGGLCAGFFYIALDEVVQLHETWGESFHTTGALHFGWVIPAAGILVVLAVLYAPFLWRLRWRTSVRLLIAGAVYVIGAVGLELPLGLWTEEHGEKTLGYALIDWVEETMEMTGVVLYLLVAFDLLSARGLSLRFGAPPPAAPAAPSPAPPTGPENAPEEAR